MKKFAPLGRICLFLIVIVSCLVAAPAQVYAQAHPHAHFSMSSDRLLQRQPNSGLYTEEHRRAQVKLTDALYARDRNPNQAIALLEEAAQLDPTFDKPLVYACEIHRGRGNYAAAVAACQEAVDRLPDYAIYHERLAEVFELARMPDRARANYERAQGLYRENQVPDAAARAGANAARLRGR
jgi:tetratricopeptide (TPR) repeat protein